MGESGPASLDSVPPELWVSPGFLLSKAADRIEFLFARALRPHGISPREYGVLASVAREGSQSQQQLGERLGIDRTTMVNIIDDLEGKGLVVRMRDPADRRRYGITLSPEGERLIRDVLFNIDVETHDAYLSVLRPGEEKQLLDMLRRLVVEHEQP